MKQSIIILYSGIGHGHKSLAENIAHHLAQDHEVDLVNLFDLEGKNALVTGGSPFFLWMTNRAPWLWNFFYTNEFFLAVSLPLRTVAASFNSKKVLSVLNAKHYDAVVSCHAMTSAIVSYLKTKNKFDGKLVVGFSDYHLHRYWMYDNVDLYLANIPEQEKEMVALGTPAQNIAVVGMTLKQMFNVDVPSVKLRLGIAAGRKVVLVAGGTSGYGIDLRAINGMQHYAVVVVVCGNNKKLHDELVLHSSETLKVFGYVSNFPELYAIADVLISKPGGLTIAESLQRNLPVLVTSYLPGQEKLNYSYLRERNLVMVDYGQIKNELETKFFSSTLATNPVRNQIVQDSGNLVREAIRRTLTGH